VKEIVSHSQRAQTQSRAAREPQPINLSERLALSPREFAAAVGRSPTYAYRQIYAGRIKPISDAGRLLIPRSEVDRFLARAVEYNPQSKGNSADENGGEA
jgi:Helix-turn-helix domain